MATLVLISGHTCMNNNVERTNLMFVFQMDVYDAAMRYRSEGKQVLLLAGKSYGCGASRDWAAKGPYMLVRWRLNVLTCW